MSMNRLFGGFTNCIRPFKPTRAPASTSSKETKPPITEQVQLANEQGRSTLVEAHTMFSETQQDQSQCHQLSKLFANPKPARQQDSRHPTRTLAQLLEEARREDAAVKSRAATAVGPAKMNSMFAINKKRFNGLFTQTTKPLHEHASHALKRLAEAQYLKACNSPYVWNGDVENYFVSPTNHNVWHTIEDRLNAKNSELSLDKIVRMVASNPTRGNGEVQVMDIGCGHGEFIRAINDPGNIKGFGVTAEGFSRNLKSFPHYKLDHKKIKTPKNEHESLNDTLENFHKFRKKIGISDECLANAQDPQTQRILREKLDF